MCVRPSDGRDCPHSEWAQVAQHSVSTYRFLSQAFMQNRAVAGFDNVTSPSSTVSAMDCHPPAVPIDPNDTGNWSYAGSSRAPALDSPVTYPILEFVRTCALLTFCGTLLIVVVGTLAINLTKFIMDQLTQLEAAYKMVKAYTASQKTEISQLRLEQEQLADALEHMNKQLTAEKTHAIQLKLENERLEPLVRTMTLTNEDQETRLLSAGQKTASVKAQNTKLAEKLMMSRRQVFKLEQEKREQKVLLQGQIDIKTLVKGNTRSIQALDVRMNSEDVDLSGPYDYRCLTPSSQSSNIDSTAKSIVHARQLQHVIHGILVGDHSIEKTLSTFFKAPSRSRLRSTTSEDGGSFRMSVEDLLERNLEARIYTIKDFVYALDLTRDQFRSRFTMSPCDSEESKRFNSVTRLGELSEIACG